MSLNFVRVGVAFGQPRGPSRRRDEYEILKCSSAYGVPIEPPALYARYVGYREDSPTGEVWVGLPLGGPAWRPQPLFDFKPGLFAEVRFDPDDTIDLERFRRRFPHYRWWMCPRCKNRGLKDEQIDMSDVMCPTCHVYYVPAEPLRENPAAEPTRGRSAYAAFHGVPPNRVDRLQGWAPGPLVLIGTGLDIGYGVQDRSSEKEGWYVHDFGRGVKIYRKAREGEPADVVLKSFPHDLMVLGSNLGLTYEGDDGRKHEVKGSSRKKLCATLPDKRKLVVVGPGGVEFVAWGGRMRIENWIYD